MATLARTDTSLVGRWWWTVDKWTLAAIGSLVVLGFIFTLAASPAVAERLGLDSFYFARRQMLFLTLGLAGMIVVSFLSPLGIRRISVALTLLSVILMILTIIFGSEIKGATRWLHFKGFSIQASEFVKPGFCVLTAWIVSLQKVDNEFPAYAISAGLYIIIVGLLLAQPDVGMAIVISVIWGVQVFIFGLPLIWVICIGLLFLGGGFVSYLTFFHVRSRVDRFLDPDAIEGFQVGRALAAFRNGGWVGRGPGEGRVKEVLPDAHADFIFAVVGEEFGLVACLIVICLFLFIVLRGISCLLRNNNLFVLLAVIGLLIQFSIQAIINMASTLNLMPPKGMTLPFISYGGSSTVALGITLGMVLALTRNSFSQRRW